MANTKNILIGFGIALIVCFLGYRMYVTESARVDELSENAITNQYEKDLTPKKPNAVETGDGASSRQQPEIISVPNRAIERHVITYKSTEFENRNETYYQNTYFILDPNNNTITVTDKNSHTFKYEVVGEIRDVYLGEKKIGYKIMIGNNKLLKSISVFVLGQLDENSILQEYHDGTMLEYFGISLIE